MRAGEGRNTLQKEIKMNERERFNGKSVDRCFQSAIYFRDCSGNGRTRDVYSLVPDVDRSAVKVAAHLSLDTISYFSFAFLLSRTMEPRFIVVFISCTTNYYMFE